MDPKNRYRMMMSPLSSPERMEYSEESSMEQSPMTSHHHTRPAPAQRSRQEVSFSRRVSCPPPMQSDKTYFKERFGINTPKQNSYNRRSTGDFLDTIDKDFGFMQLDSPPGNVHITHSTPSGTSTQSNASAKSTGRLSMFSLFSTASETPIAEADSDCSQNSEVSAVSSSTVKASHHNNNNNKHCNERQSQPLIAKNLAALSTATGKFADIEDDKISSVSKSSFQTTRPQRAETKQLAHSSNRKGQLLCYVHSVVLCLAVVILGYFGSTELRQQWCVSSQSMNVTHLKVELQSKVFGQHIATNVITHAFESFLAEESNLLEVPGRDCSLVLSFHGWTGIGKNYISNIISDLIPSSSITKLIIPLHFPHSGPEFDLQYEENIKQWILTNISLCAINLFILDEMDKATEPLIRGFKSAIQVIHSQNWNNTKIVILLLSNTAGNAINKAVFSHISSGGLRKDLDLEMMQRVVLYEDFATWHKDLYEEGLIHYIVPFLPLQYEHVEKCIKSYLKSRDVNLPQKKITQIAKDFDFFPQGNPIFSKTGCKRVTSRTDLFLD